MYVLAVGMNLTVNWNLTNQNTALLEEGTSRVMTFYLENHPSFRGNTFNITNTTIFRNTVKLTLVTDDQPEVPKQLARALHDLDGRELLIGQIVYKVTSPLLEISGILKAVVCFLCEQYQTCTQDSADPTKWLCGLFDSSFYPYGFSQGDARLPPDLEHASAMIYIKEDIPFGDRLLDAFYISVNGIISFKESFTSFSPVNLPVLADDGTVRDLLAVYWADLDLTASDTGANVFYQYYQSNTNNTGSQTTVISKAGMDVLMYSQEHSSFSPTDVAVITWDNVPPSLDNSSTGERVTFQCVIISDGMFTYVVYRYGDGAMHFNPVYERPVVVGWASTNLDTSRNNYYSFDTVLGNKGERGHWFLKIGEMSNSKKKCLQWASQNEPLLTDINRLNLIIPKCPCTEIGATLSVFWISSPEEAGCYDILPLFGNFGRRCCYRQDNSSGFETRVPSAGSFQRYTYFYGDLRSHELEDTLPKRWCCNESSLCEQYYRYRPAPGCQPRTTARSLFFGDPHVTTLDNRTYTFNGWGEFILLNVNAVIPLENKFVNFTLQGRTCFANSSITNATVFCAIALKTTNGATFTVEVSQSGKYIYIFLDGYDYSIQFQKSPTFTVLQSGIFLQKVDATLQVSTLDDIGLTITFHDNILEFTIELDTKFGNLTTGLSGNFNGNPDDDFVFPNGTQLRNTSERSLFDFGWAWAVNEKSVFTYTNGYNTSHYSDQLSVPPFLDEVAIAEPTEGQVCFGALDRSCLYDFYATKDVSFANRTEKTKSGYVDTEKIISNNPPVITWNNTLMAYVNKTLIFSLRAFDPDGDSITYRIIEQPDARYFKVANSSNSTFARFVRSASSDKELTLSLTPGNTDPVDIAIVVVDSNGLSSGVAKFEIVVCTGCSNHGECNFARKRNITSIYYAQAACMCFSPWSGEDCQRDKDGCADRPCPVMTNCTDVPAMEEEAGKGAYTCSACPVGTTLSSDSTKCVDVNECVNGSNPCTNAECINTFGSFQCNCTSGYRKASHSVCVDINECSDMKYRCPQICVNTPGFYECECEEGFNKTGVMGFGCSKTTVDPCGNQTHNCSYGCLIVSNLPKCFCESGKRLSNDGSSCEDIDECQQKLCSQNCTNTDGGYICSCYSGYILGDDGQACVPCADNKYGLDCKQTCNCRGHAKRCDKVKGCICEANRRGPICENYVNECLTLPNACPPGQECTKTDGSYKCGCAVGYSLSNESCFNIDECRNPIQNNCPQKCQDNDGSYSCLCNEGYALSVSNGQCHDVDECHLKISGCEHLCVNNNGSFVCGCHLGYILTDDRRTCIVDFQPCRGFNTSCGFGCDLVDGAPRCYCPLGFQLATDNSSCIDINECAMNISLCPGHCINTNGSYSCSCPAGQQLSSDQRSCLECDQYHWGDNCGKLCNCYQKGVQKCNPFNGCECADGWSGIHCSEDVDECSFLIPPCGSSQHCVKTTGSYLCTCGVGFVPVSNGTCVDQDECSMTPCDQMCTNTYGSYTCSCFSGFTSQGNECKDIDECAVPALNHCDQLCRNTEGGFACDCYAGFSLNTTTRNTCYIDPLTQGCNGTYNCSQVCVVEAGLEVCKCEPGYFLDPADNKTCLDIDECAAGPSPCVNGTCQNTVGNFLCSCDSGLRLADDQVTCQECDFDFYGANCSSKCACNVPNTEKCLAANGTCKCSAGWKGLTCSLDVNECVEEPGIHCGDNATCRNTNGSYICLCNVGFFRTMDECHGCDVTHWGQDCRQTCKCSSENTLDCVDATGKCLCRPGSQGNTCDEDINECLNTSTCPGSHVLCRNLNFSYECPCEAGYARFETSEECKDVNECLDPVLNTCQEPRVCLNTNGSFECVCGQGYTENSGVCVAKFKSYTVQITLVFANDVSDPQIFDNSTSQFRELAEQVEMALLASGKNLVGDSLLSVFISYFTNGSVLATTVLTIDERYTTNPDGVVSKLLVLYLKVGELRVGNSTARVTRIAVRDVILTSSSSLCQVFEVFTTCGVNQKCQEVDGTPTCGTVGGASKDLVLGLAIGIPLAVFSILVVAVLIYHGTRENTPGQESSTPSYDGSVFAGSLGRRNSGAVEDSYTKYIAPDYRDGERQVDEDYNRLIRPQEQPRSSNRLAVPEEDHPQHDDSPGTPGGDQYWIKMSTLLEPHRDLHIQRPHLTHAGGQEQTADASNVQTDGDHSTRQMEEHPELRPKKEHSERRPDSLA